MTDKKEYIVITMKKPKCEYYYESIYDYWVVPRKEVEKGYLEDIVPINGLDFDNEYVANKVCNYLNNRLEKRVNEKIKELFCKGELVMPFNFLAEWNCKNKKRIINRFSKWINATQVLAIKCHFESDLLIFSKVSSDLTPQMICSVLDIPYELFFGASTVCSEDMVLNVAKVREYYDVRDSDD